MGDLVSGFVPPAHVRTEGRYAGGHAPGDVWWGSSFGLKPPEPEVTKIPSPMPRPVAAPVPVPEVEDEETDVRRILRLLEEATTEGYDRDRLLAAPELMAAAPAPPPMLAGEGYSGYYTPEGRPPVVAPPSLMPSPPRADSSSIVRYWPWS